MRTFFVKFILLPLIGLVAFVIFLLALLPRDHVRNLAMRHGERLLDHKYRIETVEFDISLFGDVRMKQVTLTPRFEFEQVIPEDKFALETPAAAAAADDDDAPQYFCPDRVEPMPVLIDEIFFDPAIFAALTGNIGGDFEIKAAGGKITGTFSRDNIAADVSGIFLQRFGYLRNAIEMHTIGKLAAKADFKLGSGGTYAGAIKLDLSDAVICPKKFKVADPRVPFVELPLTRLGDVSGTLELAENGLLEFKDFEGQGEDLALTISGSIQFATRQRPKAHYDLRIRVTPSEQWERELVVLESICQKGADGSYQIVISGPAGEVKKDCVRNRGGNAAGAMPQARTSFSPPPDLEDEPIYGEPMVDLEPAPSDQDDYVIEDDNPNAVVDDGYVIEERPAAARTLPSTPLTQRGGVPGTGLSRNPTAAELRARGVKPVPPEANRALLRRAYD